MSVTSIRINDEREDPLALFAKEQHRSQRWQDTLEALDDIRMGRVIDGNKVHAWLDSWGADAD